MSEFKKDSELTLFDAPFKRCIRAAKRKAEWYKAKNPGLSDDLDKVLLDLAKVEIDWKPVGDRLHSIIAKSEDD